MYVCVCFAVTDSQVAAAIDAGASSVQEVTACCRAGGDCGACVGAIETMIVERRADSVRFLPVVAEWEGAPA